MFSPRLTHRLRLWLPALAFGSAVAACTASQVATTTTNLLAIGQIICQVNAITGSSLVTLVDAAGAPVLVTNMTETWVSAACALVGGIPVPPPNTPQTVAVHPMLSLPKLPTSAPAATHEAPMEPDSFPDPGPGPYQNQPISPFLHIIPDDGRSNHI